MAKEVLRLTEGVVVAVRCSQVDMGTLSTHALQKRLEVAGLLLHLDAPEDAVTLVDSDVHEIALEVHAEARGSTTRATRPYSAA